ncbi:hypothetical protein PENSPDRAFT_731104 [Peniophora sp. CONT]|nr:hypothetical protein PENSPDRAFT_731104 [Peniophora sp. CONT]
MGSSGWEAMKQALKAIRDGSDMCLPLKAACVGVVEVMELVDRVRDVTDDLAELSKRIESLVRILDRYDPKVAGNPTPDVIQQRLEGIATALNLIKSTIEVKSGRRTFQRYLQSSKDVLEVKKLFRCVAQLVENINVDVMLSVETEAIRIRQGVDKLLRLAMLDKLRHVPDAGFHAQDGRGCMTNTRVDILRDLYSWGSNPRGRKIYWLCGMAGTGKSAIAWSACDFFRENGLLAGSFFCSRTAAITKADVKRIVPTLAHAYAEANALFEQALFEELNRDLDTASKAIDRQTRQLLRGPLSDVYKATPGMLPVVFVIDALDECSDPSATETLLRELITVAPHIPAKFLLTSRPELHLRRQLESLKTFARIVKLHDLDHDVVQADIEIFISNRLSEMRQSQPDVVFPQDWPTRIDAERLASRSGILFIYASTALEYVRKDPVQRLANLIADSAGRPMTKHLDDMYNQVLATAMDTDSYEVGEISFMHQILQALVVLQWPMNVANLAYLFGVSAQRLRSGLQGLHAVVYVPTSDNGGSVYLLHASFREFLTTLGRAPERLYISIPDSNVLLFNACVKLVQSNDPPSPGMTPSLDLPDIDGEFGNVVEYACQCLMPHLIKGMPPATLATLDMLFLRNLVSWLDSIIETSRYQYSLDTYGCIDILEGTASEAKNEGILEPGGLEYLEEAIKSRKERWEIRSDMDPYPDEDTIWTMTSSYELNEFKV